MRPAAEAFRAPTMAIDGRGEVARVAADGNERRRCVAMAEPGRIERLADADEDGAELLHRRHLVLGLRQARDLDRARGAAAAGKVGDAVERGLGRAEVIDQPAKGRGPDIFAADQAEPRQPLLVGQRDARCFSVHGELPPDPEHGGGMTIRQARVRFDCGPPPD